MTKEDILHHFQDINFYYGDCMMYADLSGMLDELIAENKAEWIPVSEGLPEDGTWNLFTDGKSISVERYKMDVIDHFFPNGRWFEFKDVIAWQPLPEPYKKGGE